MAKKKRKSLLPKRIAGVKVPKSVRKGRFGELLASQTGQRLLAEALMAAGAIGAAKKAGDVVSDKMDDSGKTGDARSGAGFAGAMADRLQRRDGAGGGPLAYALGEAARVFVNVLNDQRTQPPHPPAAIHEAEPETTWTAPGPAEAGSKKKPAPSRSPPPPAG